MRSLLSPLIVAAVLVPAAAMAGSPPTFKISIGQHQFEPAVTRIPAGQRVRLRVTNSRGLPSEFESFDLNREKVVPGHTTVTVWVGPLSPGHYKIFDDFNRGTTGAVVAVKGKAK